MLDTTSKVDGAAAGAKLLESKKIPTYAPNEPAPGAGGGAGAGAGAGGKRKAGGDEPAKGGKKAK